MKLKFNYKISLLLIAFIFGSFSMLEAAHYENKVNSVEFKEVVKKKKSRFKSYVKKIFLPKKKNRSSSDSEIFGNASLALIFGCISFAFFLGLFVILFFPIAFSIFLTILTLVLIPALLSSFFAIRALVKIGKTENQKHYFRSIIKAIIGLVLSLLAGLVSFLLVL